MRLYETVWRARVRWAGRRPCCVRREGQRVRPHSISDREHESFAHSVIPRHSHRTRSEVASLSDLSSKQSVTGRTAVIYAKTGRKTAQTLNNVQLRSSSWPAATVMYSHLIAPEFKSRIAISSSPQSNVFWRCARWNWDGSALLATREDKSIQIWTRFVRPPFLISRADSLTTNLAVRLTRQVYH